MSTRYSRFLPHLIFIIDLFVLNLSFVIGLLFKTDESLWTPGFYEYLLIGNVSWMVISSLSRNYFINRPLNLTRVINRYLITIINFAVIVFSILYMVRILDVSRNFLIIQFIALVILAVINRSVILFTLDYARKKGFNKRNVLLMGEEDIIKRLNHNFKLHPEYGYNTYICRSESCNIIEKISQYIINRNIDEVFVCYKQIDYSLVREVISFCDNNLIKVKLVSDLMLSNGHAKLINYGDIPVISISEQIEMNLKVRILKRSFDLIFSFIVVTLGLPIFILLMIITKITSKGPIFYKQQRIGKDMKTFNIYKFRSMYVDAEKLGPQLSKHKDPRITPWGRIMRKTRLDELPQFYNVIKGDMSVVGPRPERQHFIEQIIEKAPNYKRLLNIKPGLTSIGQVDYGYAENVDEMCARLQYDLSYLNKVSLSSDVNIIMKTVKVMIQAKGK
ncbi:sugar transferase [Pelobium sp.]|nr:sugar transferase [Pelobium sp.]MDA9555553.1 sugar transferase [Pelobium sp.]